MQILASGKYDDIISWTPKGTSFVVRSPKKLVEEVFPLYFRKEQVVKYCSFTRKVRFEILAEDGLLPFRCSVI